MDNMMQPETTIIKLSEGVWAFDQEMVRAFLIVGSQRALLFDTGAAPCDLQAMIEKITELPLIVVHSHTDGDHTANDSQFPAICMHNNEFNYIRNKPEGVDYYPIVEGMFFELGGRKLRVIDAPGHTPGSICLLDSANGILFSGDTVSYGPVFMFGEGRDIIQYRTTLEKLKALEGYGIIYPCHNTCPIGREVIDELLAAVNGAMDGTIPPVKTDMPLPPDAPEVMVYRSGNSGILYISTNN